MLRRNKCKYPKQQKLFLKRNSELDFKKQNIYNYVPKNSKKIHVKNLIRLSHFSSQQLVWTVVMWIRTVKASTNRLEMYGQTVCCSQGQGPTLLGRVVTAQTPCPGCELQPYCSGHHLGHLFPSLRNSKSSPSQGPEDWLASYLCAPVLSLLSFSWPCFAFSPFKCSSKRIIHLKLNKNRTAISFLHCYIRHTILLFFICNLCSKFHEETKLCLNWIFLQTGQTEDCK